MKEVLTGIFTKGALKIVLGIIFGASIAFYPIKKYFETEQFKRENIEYRQITSLELTEIKGTLDNKILPYLEKQGQKIDSISIKVDKSLMLSKANYKANIEISKQIKGFDILKFYDPFMMWNRIDTVLKKKNRLNLMYAKE